MHLARFGCYRIILNHAILLLCLQVACLGQLNNGNGPVETDERFSSGKAKYEAMQRESKMPKYGPCWTMALEKLETGCKQLSDDVQHHLALLFTNCFLLKTGRQTYPCEFNQDVSECTKDMAPEAYNAYTEFFTHTQNICFFLQAQVWQELTDSTITRLKDNSETVAQRMEDSSVLQVELIKQQNKSIEYQEILMKNGDKLQRTIVDSTVDVNKMLLEFKSTTQEQRQLIFEVFDKVSVLQNVVMGEFTGFYSLIFYAVAILISYLLTSTPRTSGARFWLFVLMTANMVAERMLVYWGVADGTLDGSGHVIDENTLVYYRLSLCRKVFTLLCVAVWLWFAYKYTDINKVNHVLLMEIRKQNADLKMLLQRDASASDVDGPPSLPSSLSRHALTNGHLAASNTQLAVSTKRNDTSMAAAVRQSLNNSNMDELLENSMAEYSISRIYPDDEYSNSESDSDSSSDSGLTDHTFTGDFRDSDSDTSVLTNSTSRYSRESTPALWEEVRHLRDCTPLREMTPIPGVTVADMASPQSPGSGRGRRGGGRGGSRRSAPSPMSPTPNRYNLRSRRGVLSSMENPLVQEESPESFGRAIKNLARVALKNRAKVAAMAGGANTNSRVRHSEPGPSLSSRLGMFSSDEEDYVR